MILKGIPCDLMDDTVRSPDSIKRVKVSQIRVKLSNSVTRTHVNWKLGLTSNQKCYSYIVITEVPRKPLWSKEEP